MLLFGRESSTCHLHGNVPAVCTTLKALEAWSVAQIRRGKNKESASWSSQITSARACTWARAEQEMTSVCDIPHGDCTAVGSSPYSPRISLSGMEGSVKWAEKGVKRMIRVAAWVSGLRVSGRNLIISVGTSSAFHTTEASAWPCIPSPHPQRSSQVMSAGDSSAALTRTRSAPSICFFLFFLTLKTTILIPSPRASTWVVDSLCLEVNAKKLPPCGSTGEADYGGSCHQEVCSRRQQPHCVLLWWVLKHVTCLPYQSESLRKTNINRPLIAVSGHTVFIGLYKYKHCSI